ncbi:MAG TPA: oligoendopeptidase F [Candidatus Hydrogenedentes bacterium]|jgi:oligoendopeptidase F|nr:oligoendopeptidase F [Candidatus Hydrogenedentota bacterium]HQN00326.1 oligoendopeptidase F [Candidatus Hydrogenedentota bacterium]
MSRLKAPVVRSKVPEGDTWDLTPMFKSEAAWERLFKRLEKSLPEIASFRGTLGRSVKQLRRALDFSNELGLQLEKAGAYVQLKYSEDIANPDYQAKIARFSFLATRIGEASSYFNPEIQAIPKATMAAFLKHPLLQEYRFMLQCLLRYRPHILKPSEERLLAMQGEVAETPSKIFDQLCDADMKFGEVTDEQGARVELTQSSFRTLLESPRRAVRKEAFQKYYAVMEGHKNSLSAALGGSVQQDIYHARARNYPSAREAALFGDKMPVSAYDALIDAVHEALPAVYRYLALRKRVMGLKKLHFYDTYTAIVPNMQRDIPYAQAVDLCCEAMAPLGDAYVNTMRHGLTRDRWVDRYENRNKHSGAFSYGCYGCMPYILMNYKTTVLDSVFTLAHEAGHSMHSWYSMRAQPYQYAQYPILLAEVASTFNEQLLGHYLRRNAASDKERVLLINKEIDEIRGTIIRQTMFAEFEKIIHANAEAGQPLTVEVFRHIYRELLNTYFGTEMVIDTELELEGLRIPHFYRAFYVYKYATGLSAAISMSRKVLDGSTRDRERYLTFLRAGGSQYPLDTLKAAGVDLVRPEPVQEAMHTFTELVIELENML